ncbi:MAG: orotate phosphoribosyltransferase [Candidatus Moranbacteria bacterium]|nr:orotate phosphoribosyltransferase [Candidatus Moranbacteria bacterium]
MQLPEPRTPAEEFFAFAFERQALLFGSYRTKAGRDSPYFLDAGLFSDGQSMAKLGELYAKTIFRNNFLSDFDSLFGPAYKGIPLVTATAIALAQFGKNCRFAYNRKEPKDHGEGGTVIGGPLHGRVAVIDDVISAGTSVRQSVEVIHTSGTQFAGVVVLMDRQEKGAGELSAIQEVKHNYGVPVLAVATLADLVHYLERACFEEPDRSVSRIIENINAYRKQYGAKAA